MEEQRGSEDWKKYQEIEINEWRLKEKGLIVFGA